MILCPEREGGCGCGFWFLVFLASFCCWLAGQLALNASNGGSEGNDFRFGYVRSFPFLVTRSWMHGGRVLR